MLQKKYYLLSLLLALFSFHSFGGGTSSECASSSVTLKEAIAFGRYNDVIFHFTGIDEAGKKALVKRIQTFKFDDRSALAHLAFLASQKDVRPKALSRHHNPTASQRYFELKDLFNFLKAQGCKGSAIEAPMKNHGHKPVPFEEFIQTTVFADL